MRSRYPFVIVVAITLLSASIASADGGYSVKSSGKWYWSTDLANAIYPNVEPPAPARLGGSTKDMVAGLGLSSVDARTMRQRLLVPAAPTAAAAPKPAWTDGTVVYSMTCRGTGSSVASPSIDIDLFHTFRCVVIGARFPRLAALQAAMESALAQVQAGGPGSTHSLDKLEAAENAVRRYEQSGVPVNRPITVEISGRRSATLIGAEPV